MSEEHGFTRRQVLETSLALGGYMLSGSLNAAFSESATMKPTAEQVMGPFYPMIKPLDQDSDLTVIQGKPGKAQGRILLLTGRLIDLKGQPISDARIEIWQANTFGRYTHPNDTNSAPLDPAFEGYGVTITSEEGRYRFKTVKPGAYPAAQGWTRPPHIHFQISTKSGRLVTQMYFPGEPLNERDPLLNSASNKESLITRLAPAPDGAEADALMAIWDIVMPRT